MRLTPRWSFIAAVVVVAAATQAGTALAQPLITDPNLIFYFPFEDGDFTGAAPSPNDPDLGTFVGVLSDQSGNGFDGDVYTPDPASTTGGVFSFEIDTTNSARGGGSAKFVQSDFAATDGAVYVNLRGEELNANNFSQTVAATNSATYAAWINTTTNDVTDQSIFQGRGNAPGGGSGHGGPHFQLQSNGKLRTTMRNTEGVNTVDAPRVFINGNDTTGDSYPVDTWFHYAATYDSGTNTWAMYYNGVEILSGSGEGTGQLGNWAGKSTVSTPVGPDQFSLGFGAAYDNGSDRNFEGNLDELYVFNRALSATEIATLALVGAGDFDNDGDVDGSDFLRWQRGDSPNNGSPGDLSDWETNYGTGVGPLSGLAASVGTIPEPSTAVLFSLALAGLAAGRRRRR